MKNAKHEIRRHGPDPRSWVGNLLESPNLAIASAARGLCGSYFNPGLRAMANEGEIALVGLGNEIDLTTGDGWALIAPYGQHPHADGLQIFERDDADHIVRHFKSLWGRIKRVVTGIPLYKGHPDHPAFANVHKDKREYGQWADLEARDDGLWGRPVVSAAGADLIEGGLKYLSPNWRALPVLANGKPTWRPRILDSVGLTDRPNIPGRSLTNSQPESTMNKELILALLAALGRPLANAATATDEQINAALTEAAPVATALANEQTARSTAETRVAELTTALANEQAAHKATAKARNEALVDAAVKSGRIVEAARPVWLGRLERDFSTESVALANEKPAVKTTATTANLGDRKPAGEASAAFTALVNERMTKTGETWATAWKNVSATTEGKDLRAKMDGDPAATPV